MTRCHKKDFLSLANLLSVAAYLYDSFPALMRWHCYLLVLLEVFSYSKAAITASVRALMLVGAASLLVAT